VSRNRTPTQLAADEASHKGSAQLVELLFTSGTLRLAVAPWDVVSGGNLYTHTGALLSMQTHGEAADGTEGLDFTLTGLEAGIFDLVVSEPYQRRLVRVLEQRYNAADAEADVATVEYIGRMVAMASAEDVASRTWTVTVRTEVFDAEARRSRNLRFSDAELRRRYPSDLGAEYVSSLVERVMTRAPL
jgi:hypothetical protein